MSWPRRLELLAEWTGRAIAWVMVPMVVVQFVIVALRYVFDLGWIWMQESVLWMHAATFMLAAAYTLHHDEHVRVDIFYGKLTDRGRRLVDVLGVLFLLLPMMIFLMISSWDYVSVSWSIREGSREAGGLAYPAVPLLKSLIPLTAGLVCVQGVARLLGDVGKLLRGDNDRGTGNKAGAGDTADSRGAGP